MERTIHGPGIYTYQLSEEDLAKLDSLFQEAATHKHLWIDSVTMSGVPNYRMSRSFHLSQLAKSRAPYLTNHDRVIYEFFNKAVKEYQVDFNLRIDADEGYEILHYAAPSGQYKKHIDAGGEKFGRIVSGLLYMNDDYEGGHLEFLNFKITVHPRKGTILLFPSNYVYEHVAHPVTKGDKYAIVTFFHPIEEAVYGKKPIVTTKYSNGAVNL